MNKQEIGQLIRKTRGERGFTQKMLAEAAGVTQSAISMMEQGQEQAVSNANLVKVGKVLGLDLLPLMDVPKPVRKVLKYCTDPCCLSNLPVDHDGQLRLMPVMVEAVADELTRCRFCGMPLEEHCAHCQAPVYDAAVCLEPDCGQPYVVAASTDADVVEVERRYRQVREFLDLRGEMTAFQERAAKRDHQRKTLPLSTTTTGVSEKYADIPENKAAAGGPGGTT